MKRPPGVRTSTTRGAWPPLLIATAAWLTAACGDPPLKPLDAAVANVVVTPANDTLVSLGETLQLTATPQTSGGTPVLGKTATWSSSNATLATVGDQGLATAVANGSVMISATVDGITGDAKVLVAQSIAGVEVSATTDTITTLGGTLQLTAAAVDARSNEVANAALTWSSSDATVATVSNSGEVTSVANGTVTITAMSDGLEGTAELIVFTNEGIVDPAGSVVTVNGAQVVLDFPSGAVTQTLTVTVDATSPNPATNRAVAGTAFEFGPDGTTFDQPVTLTIAYDPSDLPSGTEEAGLGLYRAVADNWELVSNSAVDVANHVVSGAITSFSAYAVLDGPRPDALVFTEFPAQSVVAHSTIPPLVVHVLDDLGNLATRPETSVFLELLGAGSGSIEGPTVVSTADGVATFEGLSITEAGSYQVIASSGSLVPDTIGVEVTDVAPAALIAFLREIITGDREFDALSLLDPTTGSVNDALVLHRSSVQDPSWAPARDRIVFEDANCGFFFDEFLGQTVESCEPPDHLKILDLAASTTTTICTGMDLARCPDTPNWAPAGDEIALQGKDGQQVVVLDAMGGVVHTFVMPGSWDCGPGSGNSCVGGVSWSPDASMIAFECDSNLATETLCVVDVIDGEVRVVRPADENAEIANPAWSPDGRWIAYDLSGEGIEMLSCTFMTGPINCSLSSGGPGQFPGSSIVPLGSFEHVSEPSWSPDGSQIVFTCERPDSDKMLCLVEFATGEVTELGVAGKSPAWNN